MKKFLEFVIVRHSFYERLSMSDFPNIRHVIDYFEGLQRQICEAIEAVDGEQTFSLEEIETPGGGHARPRVLDGGRAYRARRGAVYSQHRSILAPGGQRAQSAFGGERLSSDCHLHDHASSKPVCADLSRQSPVLSCR